MCIYRICEIPAIITGTDTSRRFSIIHLCGSLKVNLYPGNFPFAEIFVRHSPAHYILSCICNVNMQMSGPRAHDRSPENMYKRERNCYCHYKNIYVKYTL